MLLKNITKSNGPHRKPGGTPENNGFDWNKQLSCITCTLQLKRFLSPSKKQADWPIVSKTLLRSKKNMHQQYNQFTLRLFSSNNLIEASSVGLLFLKIN